MCPFFGREKNTDGSAVGLVISLALFVMATSAEAAAAAAAIVVVVVVLLLLPENSLQHR